MAKKKTKKDYTYYLKHKKELQNIIRNSTDTDHDELVIFKTLKEGITRYPLRYYQLEALYILDYLYQLSTIQVQFHGTIHQKSISDEVKDLLAEVADKQKAPFIGFEMATGSGKTMVMGASMYLLNQKYGVKNFLLLTPPGKSDIYHKTIRNFGFGQDSVWAENSPFGFNLITGENYAQTLDIKPDLPNLFIFNIDKFKNKKTDASTGKKKSSFKTERIWESAIWEDQDGNAVSMLEFLQLNDLVIITDESHHLQSGSGANAIIKKFLPKAVLEFTATAVETNATNKDKNEQNIVYKYNIAKFLEDKHGKLVRALALVTPKTQKEKKRLADYEKQKIITTLLVHLVKKKAMLLDESTKSLHPISLVKVKDHTPFAQQVSDYLTKGIQEDHENVQIILDKVLQKEVEISSLVADLYTNDYKGDVTLIHDAIAQVGSHSIFYHGQSDALTKQKFESINNSKYLDDARVEVVVYMKKLDEGIDLPNIYTIAVINDNSTKLRTVIKQIIGRGVRLNKDKREHDHNDGLPLLQQTEKLHIVCDAGKSFEDEIKAVQAEFGLQEKLFSLDSLTKEKVINKVNTKLLKGKSIPRVKARPVVKEGVDFMELAGNVDNIIDHYCESNCFSGESDSNLNFLKYRPDSFFMEVDLFSDKKEYHKQIINKGGVPMLMELTNKDADHLYNVINPQLFILPDNLAIKRLFREYVQQIKQIELKYYQISDSDTLLAKQRFYNTFTYFYINFIEKHYFDIKMEEDDQEVWELEKEFQDVEIYIPSKLKEDSKGMLEQDKEKLVPMIKEGYPFYGYTHNVYDYVYFDSYTEKKLADYFDTRLEVENKKNMEPFWIKNNRQIYFSYGAQDYYPDFIVLFQDKIFVVEGKGDRFFDPKKSELLMFLHNYKGDGIIKDYIPVIAFEASVDAIEIDSYQWDTFVNNAAEDYDMKIRSISAISSVPDTDKYIYYLPLFSAKSAHRRFVKQKSRAKISGWVKVPYSGNEYPSSVIAVVVHGGFMHPLFRAGQHIYLNTDFDLEKIEDGTICLIRHDQIDNDDYPSPDFTIRRISFVEEKEKRTTKNYMLLTSESGAFPEIKIEYKDSNEIEIVGVLYDPKD